jgi:alpha-1,3-rhamnosyl/mannosyltransferase
MDLLRLTRAVWKERPDVFFSPSVYTYFPLPPGQASVVTIHDAIVERFPELTMPNRRARIFWRAKVRLAIRQAKLILTVSDFSAGELGEVLGLARERIRVVAEAPADAYRPSETADIRAVASRFGLTANDRWFVYVGGFNPHKRLDAIVRAHADVVRRCPENPPHLLLVGTVSDDVFHGNVEAIRSEIAAGGTESLVHWTGFVADEDLRHLHSGALALLLVSEAEGFGLPAVEAAACGTPVIATTRSPLPRLLEGGGIFVAPGDERALADAMHRMLTNEPERRAMGFRAREQALGLRWEDGARSALATLQEARRS